MEGTASQPGLAEALQGGRIWLGGHGFVPEYPVGWSWGGGGGVFSAVFSPS